MLDVSLRAGVLALPARLARLPTERGPGLRYYRNLLSARVVTDEVLALNQGTVVEQGPTKGRPAAPEDEYTVRLLDVVVTPLAAASAR
jgi:peptide/nickel transport system ATP-binding protein